MSTASVFSDLEASSEVGVVRAVPILDRQSETKRMSTMRSRSAGPLISKLRKSEFALNKSSVSSMMSASPGSAKKMSWFTVTGAIARAHTYWGRTAVPGPDWQNGDVANLTGIELIQ